MKDEIKRMKEAIVILAECIDQIEWNIATDIQKQMRVHNKAFKRRENRVKEILEGNK